jgi:YfiH family protein
MEWIIKSGLTFGTFPPLAVLAPELDVFITTRGGGTSKAPFDSLNLGGRPGDSARRMAENRRRVAAALGLSARRLARTGQIHGAEIAVVRRGGVYRGFDGFITDRRGLTLAISTADCYSVVIYSPPERALAALHVGRRGAERGIIARAVGMLRARYHIDPAYAVAVVGPGVCADCYAVRRDDALRFPRRVRRYEHGAWHLDLAAFCVEELWRLGLRRRFIIPSGLCTSCNPDLFFSHRRDCGVTGRHWTLATIKAI